MSYVTYNTEAVVCGSYDRGSANRSYLLFTRDAGMVFAEARSVREERSRQRYALQVFSVVAISLVKGKQGWLVGSVEALHNPFLGSETRADRTLLIELVRRLRRFIHGEEAVPQVYTDLVECFTNVAVRRGGERVLACFSLRLLHALGYVPRADWNAAALAAPTIRAALPLTPPEPAVIGAIEHAVAASHL